MTTDDYLKFMSTDIARIRQEVFSLHETLRTIASNTTPPQDEQVEEAPVTERSKPLEGWSDDALVDWMGVENTYKALIRAAPTLGERTDLKLLYIKYHGKQLLNELKSSQRKSNYPSYWNDPEDVGSIHPD